MQYKVLTLTQPWATLVAIGAKKIETRSWSTSYRGPLAIHAADGLGPVGGLDGLADLIRREPFKSALGDLIRDTQRPTWVTTERLPRGAIVAACELIDCREVVENRTQVDNYWRAYEGLRAVLPPDEPERSFGDYTPGRYAWLLADIRALPEPIPARGQLGLWTWDGELPI